MCVDLYPKRACVCILHVYTYTVCKRFLRYIHCFNYILEHRFCIFFFFPFLSTLFKVLFMMVVFNTGVKCFLSNHFLLEGSLISEVTGSSFIRTKIFSLPPYLFFKLIFMAGGYVFDKKFSFGYSFTYYETEGICSVISVSS